MKAWTALTLSSTLLLGACAAPTPDPCKQIVQMSDQARRCDQMRRNMDNLKKNPQLYNAAQQRYQEECVNFLYYRENFSEQQLKCLSDQNKTQDTRTQKD